MQSWIIAVTAIGYLLVLFAVAWFGDRRAATGRERPSRPAVYALSLAVYCTSWTFLGSVGVAARDGWAFVAIYLGPILVFLAGPALIGRLVRLAKAERITTVADMLGSRFGKSPSVAALAAVIAILGTVPYVALQLKAISTSVTTLVAHYGAPLDPPPVFGDLALPIALLLGLFAGLFGTRHADATEHQDGLVLAIALESVVKLAAFVAVGLWATFVLFTPDDLIRAVAETPGLSFTLSGTVDGRFIAALGLSLLVILLLPRQFHMTVVENRSREELRRARWLFPLYLIAINLFVAPLAVAGVLLLGTGVDADFYVLALPLSQGQDALALFVFVGALSASTAMVIVASVALSITISNDLVLPWLLQRRRENATHGDATRLILNLRRWAIFAVVVLGYCYYRAAGTETGLASIGLLSFAAIAQLAPPLIIGLVWKGANARGATVGMLLGILGWTWTLLLPALLAGGGAPFDGLGLHASALIGVDPLLYGSLVSLFSNVLGVIVGSRTRAARPQERIQAAIFTEKSPASSGSVRRTRTTVSVGELSDTIARYLGAGRTRRALDQFSHERGRALAAGDTADAETVRFAEQVLAAAIGSASSRLVLSLLFQRHAQSSRSALQLLDDASEALQYNRDLLRSALDQVDQGLAIFDADYRLTFWNRQFRDHLNLPPEYGHVGRPLTAVLEAIEEAGEIDARARERAFATLTHPPGLAQLSLSRSDRVIELRANLMPDGGLVATVTDTTERVRRAAALREINETLEARVEARTAELRTANTDLAEARHAAEAANLGKTRFLAAAGHDIIQPLNAARLYAAALQERSGDHTPAERDATVDRIASSLESAEAIIGAVLDISRLEAGGLTPNVETVPLAPLFRQIETELGPSAREKGVALRFVSTSAAVRSDRNLLRRLVQNLVSNAIKYTRKGKVVVGLRRTGPDACTIEVVDSGIGIPGDQIQAIYREFVRLEEGSQAAGGLGLGLSIVERIARALDHAVTVQSVHGRGTRFAVRLTRAAATEAALAPDSPVALPGRHPALELAGMRVLCIDNETEIRSGMDALLTGWGCVVATAAGTSDALARLTADQAVPDAVLVDYHLDGETGFTAVAALRDALGPDLPVVLITADRSPDLRRRALAADMDILAKPLKPAALRATLGRHATARIAAE